MKKLATVQGENYTTGSLLDYDYIKNRYRLIAVDLSKQKDLDADLKTIQQIEKNVNNDQNAVNADGAQNMFVLTILEKSKKRD